MWADIMDSESYRGSRDPMMPQLSKIVKSKCSLISVIIIMSVSTQLLIFIGEVT